MVGHLSLTLAAMLFFLSFATLLVWAPVFAFAYWRRQFGGTRRGYLKAYLATSFATVAFFLLLGVAEELAR